ncbi:MAG TPA: TetR family transcriptional regulator [Pseudonocardia sp.]|nr:TetR family transcriptional regulator [Pseudonocardia sp.]
MSTSDRAQEAVSFASRTRERLRQEILAAAIQEVIAGGWRGLRMQSVAGSVGISRQTINAEFADKRGLAQALVLSIAAAYADECAQIIEDSRDLESGMRDSFRRGLEQAAADQVFKVVMTPDSSDTFLPLYTSDGAPLVTLIATRIAAAMARRWPELDPERLRVGSNASVRFILSHIVLPLQPIEQTAEEAVRLFVPFFQAR